ncbi:Dynactin subunit 4 [Homalodisca vitripennis]|nr:Dynactin subunit 4 [Homalodisca vitripennis]
MDRARNLSGSWDCCLYISEVIMYCFSKYVLVCGREVHQYETRGRDNFRTQQQRLMLSQHLPQQVDVRLINRLPESVKNSNNTNQFKTHLKRLLVSKAFYSKPTSGRESLMLPSIGQRPSVPKPPRRVQATVTAVLALPSGGVILPPRDDAAEYDDSGDTHNFQDDPKVVVWRKGNKAAVRFTLTPDSTLAVGDPVLCGFVLCYGYVNTMVTVEPARVELQVRIYLAPGNVCGDPQ